MLAQGGQGEGGGYQKFEGEYLLAARTRVRVWSSAVGKTE